MSFEDIRAQNERLRNMTPEQHEQRARWMTQQTAISRCRTTFSRSNPPRCFEGQQLKDVDDRDCSWDGLLAARHYITAWDENRKSGRGLFLVGDIGTGKTLVASALANTLVEGGLAEVGFYTVTEVLARLKDWDQNTDTLALCKDVALLVLDDIGIERVTEWGVSQLFDILNARYQGSRPTVYTSNLSLDQLAAHYVRSLERGSDQMPAAQAKLTVERILSRVGMVTTVVPFIGEDQRKTTGTHTWIEGDGAA
jgi:DNA replication protein DnaC